MTATITAAVIYVDDQLCKRMCSRDRPWIRLKSGQIMVEWDQKKFWSFWDRAMQRTVCTVWHGPDATV